MDHKIMKSLAVAAVLSMGIAACGSSGSNGSAPAAKQGKTLVIESTPLSPMTDTFNPYSLTSTGYLTNSVSLYNEPLYIFNTLNPTQAPIPFLATGTPTWSNAGKTLTLPIRAGVKWNDGKAFSASDVAFTFNMLAKNPKLNTSGAPVVTSATAASPTSATLNFAAPQYANLFSIGQVYIVPPPQGYTLKANPNYWQKSKVHVPEIDFPSYNTNANLVPPIANGQIDWAGNYVAGIQSNYLSKSPDNNTWFDKAPFFSDNNVVGLWLNVTKAPLNDVAVRRAISVAINRQQLSSQAETGYEPVATSSSGLMLPAHNSFLDSSLANDLPPTGDAAKAASILKADGWVKTGGKWTKNGKKLSFSIEDPVPYTDYYTGAQLIVRQLNAIGFDAKVDGKGNPTVWAGDVANGTFDATIHWSNQGNNPYFFYSNWLDKTLSAPVGKPAAGDFGRFNSPQAQAALTQFASTSSSTTQAQAITKLENVMSSQVPIVPLMYGGAWSEYSTRNYTGWPSASNPYMVPVPNIPYLEYTLLQLKPVS